MPDVTIRTESPEDAQHVREVNLRAFGQVAEADIVDVLREMCPEGISLVAIVDEQLVGHLLLTPAIIEAAQRPVQGVGLAPMAVVPEFQRQGIGSQLVRRGLEMVRQAGYPFVIVLGHAAYYPRFGFEPASKYGITSEYENVPDEAFMILVLDEDALKNAAGVAKYRPEFSAAM